MYTLVMDFDAYAGKLGLKFNDIALLKEALTHRSYLNESKDSPRHNERLEFLGDAVLQLASAHFLYQKFPAKPEGDLTQYRSALVNAVTLAKVAETLGMNDMLLLSKGEKKGSERARQIILADAFEAVLGALYLDQGYDAADKFLLSHVFPLLDDVIAARSYQDAKSRFQELAQDKKGITPSYKLISEEGPDHDKKFLVALMLGEKEIARGTGKSKQEAEQSAARAGLEGTGW